MLLTQADWVLIRLLSVAYYARCVDPMFTDAFCNAEVYLEKKIGSDLLNCAMYTVRDDVPRPFRGYNESDAATFCLISALYTEIELRGDRQSQRHADMYNTSEWFCWLNITA